MNSITFIVGSSLHSIATPNSLAAWILYHALHCAGIQSRVWKHRTKGKPELMA